MLDQPSREVLLRVACTSVAKIGFMRWGREVTGALPTGTEILKGIKEEDPKSVFEVDNTSGNSQSTSPSCSMAGGVQPGSCKSNAISRKWGGSRAQTRKNEERWSGFNRSSSAGEGGVTIGAASPVSGELVTAETWQSAVWPGWGYQSGWRVARHLGGRSIRERERPQRSRPARGLRHLLREVPAALRQ